MGARGAPPLICSAVTELSVIEVFHTDICLVYNDTNGMTIHATMHLANMGAASRCPDRRREDMWRSDSF